MKKVMIFGVFDGLHGAHKAVLKEAKAFGDYLIVAVAQDHIVEHLKGNRAKVNLNERIEHIKQEDAVDEVIIGDKELSTWEVVKEHQPAVIAIGHDQNTLQENLEANFDKLGYQPEMKLLKEYEANEDQG
jgi:cytidyltransferase-like protein